MCCNTFAVYDVFTYYVILKILTGCYHIWRLKFFSFFLFHFFFSFFEILWHHQLFNFFVLWNLGSTVQCVTCHQFTHTHCLPRTGLAVSTCRCDVYVQYIFMGWLDNYTLPCHAMHLIQISKSSLSSWCTHWHCFFTLHHTAFSSSNLLSFPSTPSPLSPFHSFSSLTLSLLLLTYPSTPSPSYS